MSTLVEVYPGTAVQVEATFRRGLDDTLGDPGTITMTVKRPHDVAEAPVNMAQVSPGVYRATILTVNDPGTWYVQVSGAGGQVAAMNEIAFKVLRPALTPTPPIP